MKADTFDKLMGLREIPGAFDDWKEYRKCLTDFIIQNSGAGSSALVIGAGRCNDLDLCRLSGYFGRMALLDIDEASMKEACRKQKTEGNIDLLKGDLVGIPDGIYHNLCRDIESLIREQSISKLKGRADDIFADYIQCACEQMDIAACLDDLEYDSIICCGVHSQLNNVFPQLAELYSHYTPLNLGAVYNYASEMNRFIAVSLNEKMTRMLKGKKNSVLILGLEEKRLGIQGGVEGAWQALENMKELAASGKIRILEEKHVLWPFEEKQGKIYEMNLLALNPETLIV